MGVVGRARGSGRTVASRIGALRLLDEGRPHRRELAIAGAFLLLVGLLSHGSHILNGGFYLDDWSNAASTHYVSGGAFGDTINFYWDFTRHRPVLVLYVPLTHWVFGDSAGLHLLWATLLAIGASFFFYWLLRELGLARLHAGAIATLLLLFPFADVTRLWSTASMTHLSIGLLLAGMIVALRGLRHSGRRAVLMHAGAVALYALSIGTYELTAPAVVAAFLLYRVRAPWRPALVRLVPDALVTAFMLLVFTTNATNPQPVASLSEQIDRARVFLDQGTIILAKSAEPWSTPARNVVLGLLAAIAIAAIVVMTQLGKRDEARREMRRWLWVAATGLVAAAVGWVLLLPADPYYIPLRPGLGNRVNVVAALGLVTTVYAVAALVGLLLFRGLARWRVLAAGGAVACALVVAAGYMRLLDIDIGNWERSAVLQEQMMDTLRAQLPNPPPSSTIYTYGHPAYVAADVPVWSSSWDLNGAVKMEWDRSDIAGFPMLPGTAMNCGRERMGPVGPGYGAAQLSPYGQGFFADLTARRVQRIDSRQECRVASRRVTSGVLYQPPG